MVASIAELTNADEYLNHQIANTFAAVGEADHSWTEKIWVTLARKDGQLQASFGIGKYANRNLMDGFAGVQSGSEQRTIRASRVLRPRVEETAVGPLRYEILEPYRKLRLVVEENSAQPVRFDLVWSSDMPAFFEGRDQVINHGRVSSDVVRYHQSGTVSGWIEIDGVRHTVKPDEWYGFRDRSWGIREHVGRELTDLPVGNTGSSSKLSSDYHFNWFVSELVRPDGSKYDLAYYFREFKEPRGLDWFTAYINEQDGTQRPVMQVYPQLTYRKSDHAVMGGKIYAMVRGDGRNIIERVFEVEALDPDMGFHLNPAMYGPWKDQIHGAFMGEEFLDGECVTDVNNPEKFAGNRRWEIRDRPLRIREGDAVGYANIESIVIGDWPAASFV